MILYKSNRSNLGKSLNCLLNLFDGPRVVIKVSVNQVRHLTIRPLPVRVTMNVFEIRIFCIPGWFVNKRFTKLLIPRCDCKKY
jgi:hypothetical protein